MRPLVLAMFISLDGYIEGPNGQLVPPAWSNDLEINWSGANLEMAGAVLYGRVCYEGMAGYWQSPSADQKIAGKLAALPKYVVSTTVKSATWKNTTIIRTDFASSVRQLKEEAGKPIVAFGGAGARAELLEQQLVDELRLLVTPNLFGGGKRLFDGGFDRLDLALVDSKMMDTGAIISHYRGR